MSNSKNSSNARPNTRPITKPGAKSRTKILSGKDLAGYIKERQAREVKTLKSQKIFPKLMIIRDSDNPVIVKYVNLKKKYGDDIGVEVIDQKIAPVVDESSVQNAKKIITAANKNTDISGIIVQLPLKSKDLTDEVVNTIAPAKDVDGLNQTTEIQATGGQITKGDKNQLAKKRIFESATATAITWLLAGHDIELKDKKVALVGYGRLVGQPLKRIFDASNVDVKVFRHDSNLKELKNYNVIITATGVPHLITSEMVSPDTVIVDAGTASENGVLVGDVDDEVRNRTDLTAITPITGGVGPLTVTTLFENVLIAAKR